MAVEAMERGVEFGGTLSPRDPLELCNLVNDILRMAGQAIEEDPSPLVRSYLLQIHTSGQELMGELHLLRETMLDLQARAAESSNSAPPEETFTAPNARILLVDDNELNLAVTEGVLAPLQMHIDLADSGAACIEQVQRCQYDLIFMDHMMPDMDGVETTRWIRKNLPSYRDVPIIALTANTEVDAWALFRQAGMNDFVAKPVSIQNMREKLHHWLPAKKLVWDTAPPELEEECPLPDIPELNLDVARSLLGDDALLLEVLSHYCRSVERNRKKVEQLWADQNLPALTIEVHSLKSASKQIGADQLASQAALLEMAGKRGNTAYFQEHLEQFLDAYSALGQRLQERLGEERSEKVRRPEQTVQLLEEMQEALDELDAVHIDDVLEALSETPYEGEEAAFLERLRTAADECELDTAAEIVQAWQQLCKGS